MTMLLISWYDPGSPGRASRERRRYMSHLRISIFVKILLLMIICAMPAVSSAQVSPLVEDG